MKISAVCFDLGKVLIDFDWQIGLRRMAEKSPHSPDELSRLINEDSAILAYEKGEIPSDTFFQHLKKSLSYKGTPGELRECFSEIFTPLSDHIALAAALSAHYPLAIISNTNDAHITYLEKHYTFFSLFSARIYSHQVGLIKPQPEIYKMALEQLGEIDPQETLFIDDLEPNILGAVQLGWQTIRLRKDVNLGQALASYELRGLP